MKYSISESAVRARARRMGYMIRKSRRALGHENHGRFMLIDPAISEGSQIGHQYDATLEDIAAYMEPDIPPKAPLIQMPSHTLH